MKRSSLYALTLVLATLGFAPPAMAQATPPASAPALPEWSAEQWQAVMDAVRHTEGTAVMEYYWAAYTSEGQARVASVAGVSQKTKRTAIHLAAVSPVIRAALAGLLLPGDRSKPIPTTNAEGKPEWHVVQLVSRSPGRNFELDDQYRRIIRRFVAQGYLPSPDTLMTDRIERSKAAFVYANSAAKVAAVPTDLTPDVEYGDFNTPLTLAILTNKMDLARALVARGASVNRCGIWGCPLAVAAKASNETDALAWTEWLLSAGARPDLVDGRFNSSNLTPLTQAMQQGYATLAQKLVAAGAPLNGVPGERYIPIEVAARDNKRALVDWLIARGASVLPFNDRSPGLGPHMNGNLYTGALMSGDASFVTWAEKTMLDTARKSRRFVFDAFVEQGGRRFALTDGSAHTLKPAPFQLVMVMKPGESESVTVGASLAKEWSDEVRRNDRRNPLFRPYSSAAMAEPPSPDALELFVGMPCTSQHKADETCPGVQMVFHKDPTERRDFHEVRADRHEYVREVRSLYDVSVEDKGNVATPLERLTGKTLYLVLSDVINLGGGADGQRMIAPRYVNLSFR